MRVFESLENLPTFKNSVITVGTFDGVHKGHQQILQRLKTLAQKINGESVLITFSPHPRLVVQPESSRNLKLINTLDEKIELLQRYAIDNLVVVPFTKEFAVFSAEDYIENFLIKYFQPKIIAIGYDHRFGKNRVGDIHLLKKFKAKHHFEIERIEKKELETITISSTKIRKALEEGNVALAKDLMQHFFLLEGIVVKGKQIGRTIGFPTANIEVQDQYKLIPKNGVYAVNVKVNQQQYKGMLNIGTKPTFNHQEKTIEVNIFDFNEDIYGEKIQIEFVQFIREEKKYSSKEALQQQIVKDKQNIIAL